ncbi:MAG: folate-binding protein [Propionicimonas sp.]|uniref:CAF17-like 4Fe-4S cluster assembly/insertion protein YgfZ n=1 Tax=Propionicimonas sp. TaxID=1955623 RepID=UPI002B1FA036|nr:folate-binding protein [Propionicimonas sp.]MEA4944953.1 folate-binding protein [Propionicimonas sp.]MEA5053958.1 folate-binding protein [Propionicimonas sp.]MEA5119256.1 folate-binding protein [Propionicimonas sp.]
MTAVRHTEGPDAGAVWHYGDPLREQRRLGAGQASVDLSHRPVFSITGRDRLRWLNDISSQDFASLAPGQPTAAYILDAQGHLTHVFGAMDDGETLWAHTEPGHAEPLLAWLQRMVFAARVEIAEQPDKRLVLPAGAPAPVVVDAAAVEEVLGEVRAGTWAMEALRIAAGQPRVFLDTDEKTIPNELANPENNLLGPATHLAKGCYPGQETVARIYNLGRPPRRLTLLHLDGSAERLPAVGADVMAGDRVVGRMGSSERHHELGPIGLALVKRQLPTDADLVVDGIAAGQQVLVDPEAGLHWRPAAGLGRR